MPLQSDLNLDMPQFDSSSASQKTKAFNEHLIDIMAGIPRWYEVGAPRYREMRANGETPLPKPTYLPQAQTTTVPSRDAGRDIPLRIFEPAQGAPKGVFYHIHGGGWVLQDEASQDPLLAFLTTFDLTVVSVGYRLAPEDPWPAGVNDCYDVAEWLVDNAPSRFGAPLTSSGGESAGGHLSALVAFHLRTARPAFAFKALLLNFGCFDLSTFLPSVMQFERPLVLTGNIMAHYIAALLPGTSASDRAVGAISPLYADLAKLAPLPPALFSVGTEDCLLDDSVCMFVKWRMARAPGTLKVYPGAPHGFCHFGDESGESPAQWRRHVAEFLGEHL